MSNERFMRIVEAVAEATAGTAIFIAGLTIGGEEYVPLKDWLKAMFTHHWLGKSALAIVFFALMYLLRARGTSDIRRVRRSVWFAILASGFMVIAILGFTAYKVLPGA